MEFPGWDDIRNWANIIGLAKTLLTWTREEIRLRRLRKVPYVLLASLLRELSFAVYNPGAAEQALNNVLQSISDIVSRGDERVRVGLLVPTADHREFRLLAGYPYSSRGRENLRLPNDPRESVAGEAWATKKIIIVPDVDNWPTFQRNPYSSRPFMSLMVVPVTEPLSGEPVALLSLDALRRRYFTDDDQKAALALVHVVAALLRTAETATRLVGHR